MLSEVQLQAELVRMIRAELNRRGWKDAELARRLEWSSPRVSRALGQKKSLTVDDLEEILQALGIECSEIIERIAGIVEPATPDDAKIVTAEVAELRPEYAVTSPLRQRAEDLRERAGLYDELEKLTREINELKKKGGH
jgi:transcriptional regulator with XRE-family HTH domain